MDSWPTRFRLLAGCRTIALKGNGHDWCPHVYQGCNYTGDREERLWKTRSNPQETQQGLKISRKKYHSKRIETINYALFRSVFFVFFFDHFDFVTTGYPKNMYLMLLNFFIINFFGKM